MRKSQAAPAQNQTAVKRIATRIVKHFGAGCGIISDEDLKGWKVEEQLELQGPVEQAAEEIRRRTHPPKLKPTPAKKEPPRVTPILTRDQWPKPDPEAAKAITTSSLLREGCPPGAWFDKLPRFFTDAAYSEEDQIELASGIGTSVHRYGDVRENLHAFDGVNPNPVWSGRDTKIKERRFVIVRFLLNGNLDAEYSRATHLARTMRLALAVFNPVARTIEFWHDTKGRKPSEITKWFKTAMSLGADGATSLAGFRAKIPNSLCGRPAAGALRALREAGLDDRGILAGDRCYVLYFAGKALEGK